MSQGQVESLRRHSTRGIATVFARHRYLYLMGAPVVVYYLMFHYAPMYGVIIAFKEFNILRGIIGSEWAGLKYFDQVFSDSYFYIVLRNTVVISLLKLLFSFPVPIVLALLLNEFVNPSYKRTIQTIIYLPHFISWVIIGGILFNLLSVNYGVVNNVLQLAGQEPIFFMASKKWFRPLLVITTIWKNAGWGTIIYLAALSSVNPELYEAAVMDGAGKLRQMWSITLPGIRATIIVMFIIALSRLMNAGFNQVIVLYNSMVMQVGDIIDTYVYRSGMQLGRFSYASVVGLFKGAVGFILILSADLVAKRVFHERGII